MAPALLTAAQQHLDHVPVAIGAGCAQGGVLGVLHLTPLGHQQLHDVRPAVGGCLQEGAGDCVLCQLPASTNSNMQANMIRSP